MLILSGKTKPYLMAHRGNSVLCPENTLAAFRQAIEDGADILETDLHLTADGVFVCIHDATLDRTTNGSGPVAQMTLDQIKKLSAGDGRFETEQVPTLQEVMAQLPPEVALALELKTDRFLESNICRQLVAELQIGGVSERTVFLSFSVARLQTMKAAAPDIPTGLITLKRVLPTAPTALLGPFWPILALNPSYVWWAHRLGKMVCPLDVNPDARLGFYRWLGCDAIMTNNPARTGRILRKKHFERE